MVFLLVDNFVWENFDVKDNQSVIVTENAVNGNLKIQSTAASCTDTGNDVNGNFDGCP